MSFKVGDRVKVISLPYSGYTNILNEEGEIVSTSESPSYWPFMVKIKNKEGSTFGMNKENFELVESEKKVELTSKFKVGDRVRSYNGAIGTIIELKDPNEKNCKIFMKMINFDKGGVQEFYSDELLELAPQEQPKFSIGDKVKIIGLVSEEGKIGEITEKKTDEDAWRVSFSHKLGTYPYAEHHLELVVNQPKFKIGDWVKVLPKEPTHKSLWNKTGEIISITDPEDPLYNVQINSERNWFGFESEDIEIANETDLTQPEEDILPFLKSLDEAQKFVKEKSYLIDKLQNTMEVYRNERGGLVAKALDDIPEMKKTIEHLQDSVLRWESRENDMMSTLVSQNNWIAMLEGEIKEHQKSFEKVRLEIHNLQTKQEPKKEESIFDKYNSVTAFKTFLFDQFQKRKECYQDDYQLLTYLDADGYWNIRIHFPQNPKLLSS